MKYAVYLGTATNIGEEIQSIAAQRFLPSVDHYIIKEQMHRFHSDEKTKLIMNAWYMVRPNNFPPQDCIDPLLISMHFQVEIRDTILSSAKAADYLKKYGPVGCRDMSTKKWLDENNIPAYFSGCLTSTLLPNENLRKKYPEKYILCVDCYDEIVEYVKKHTEYPVLSFSKEISPCIGSVDRFEVAKAFLFLYQNAHCVITTNLHTAMPCLAFNTPVCAVEIIAPMHFGIGRFDGMEGYFHWETVESFLAGGYDFNDPPENPRAFEESRDLLIGKCREFTGYDSLKPALDDDFNPLYAVISSISCRSRECNPEKNKNRVKKALYSAKRKDLLKMLILKTIRKVDEHDIRGDQYLQRDELFKK